MKPNQPTIDPNAAGDEVKRLLAEDGTANAALKDLRSAKAARKEQLKALLLLIWAAFDRGETVNGFKTRKEWCREFAKVTPRTCENIVYGRAKRKANTGSLAVIDLKEGMLVRMFGGSVLKVTSFGTLKDGDETSIELVVEEYEEQLPAKKAAPKPKKEIVHAIFTTNDGTYNRFTYCGKNAEKVKTAGWEADGETPIIAGVTCKSCLRKNRQNGLSVSAQPTKETKPTAKREKKVHFVDDIGLSCQVTRKLGAVALTTTVEADVTCKECLGTIRYNKESEKELEASRTGKVHSARADNANITRCSMHNCDEAGLRLSDKLEEVTCERCCESLRKAQHKPKRAKKRPVLYIKDNPNGSPGVNDAVRFAVGAMFGVKVKKA